MKYFTLLFIFILLVVAPNFATRYTVTNVGTSFSPSSLTIKAGDTVIFSLSNEHNAVEVSLATYNSNGNTSNGGFSVTYGGGTVIMRNPGTYYYVCQPHAQVGMKGVITVQAALGIDSPSGNITTLDVQTNSAARDIRLKYQLQSKTKVTIELVNSSGVCVAILESGYKDAGLQEETYVMDKPFSSGLYFVILRCGNQIFSDKVLLK